MNLYPEWAAGTLIHPDPNESSTKITSNWVLTSPYHDPASTGFITMVILQ